MHKVVKNNVWILNEQVETEEELVKAIEMATGDKNECLCFIEAIVHRDDTSKELLDFGNKLAATNSRPPK